MAMSWNANFTNNRYSCKLLHCIGVAVGPTGVCRGALSDDEVFHIF